MKYKLVLAAAAALLLGSTAASAAIIPTLTGVTNNGSDYTFSYQGTLSGDAGLTSGSRLVIFDFAGYVPGSVFSPFANVTASSELLTSGLLTPPGSVDNPGIENLVFTWNDGDFRTSGGPFGEINFSGISARSIYGALTSGIFSAQTVKNNPDGVPGGAGTPIFDTGAITVPSAVPEPATWGMLIVGFFGLGAAMRRKRHALAVA